MEENSIEKESKSFLVRCLCFLSVVDFTGAGFAGFADLAASVTAIFA
jgi:hypothetical protein